MVFRRTEPEKVKKLSFHVDTQEYKRLMDFCKVYKVSASVAIRRLISEGIVVFQQRQKEKAK